MNSLLQFLGADDPDGHGSSERKKPQEDNKWNDPAAQKRFIRFVLWRALPLVLLLAVLFLLLEREAG